MKPISIVALGALVVLTGCAGTRLPKLAKCTGPYRYANQYGTVLPSLPVPAQLSASPSSVPIPSPAASSTPLAPVPVAPPSQEDTAPAGKTGALMPIHPSC